MLDTKHGMLRPYSHVIGVIARWADLFVVAVGLWLLTLLDGVTWANEFTMAALLALVLSCFSPRRFPCMSLAGRAKKQDPGKRYRVVTKL